MFGWEDNGHTTLGNVSLWLWEEAGAGADANGTTKGGYICSEWSVYLLGLGWFGVQNKSDFHSVLCEWDFGVGWNEFLSGKGYGFGYGDTFKTVVMQERCIVNGRGEGWDRVSVILHVYIIGKACSEQMPMPNRFEPKPTRQQKRTTLRTIGTCAQLIICVHNWKRARKILPIVAITN